jgi:hypothetical protein
MYWWMTAWWGYEYATEFRAAESEHVVIFINRSAYRKAVVAVRQDIGHGKFFKSARTGCLDDSHVGNIMRR